MSHPTASRPRRLISVSLSIAALFCLVLVVVEQLHRLSGADEQSRMSAGTIKRYIAFTGPITRQSVDRLEAVFSSGGPDEITGELLLQSEGGRVDQAERLASLMNEHKMRLFVTKQSLCASACVLAFWHSASREADPDARFLFHQGFSEEKSLVNFPYALWHDAWPEHPLYMDQIVGEMSPILLSYLQNCGAIEPLRTEHGITMTWAEITAVIQGAPVQSCSTLLQRRFSADD